MPFTEPVVSHWRDASKRIKWFFSHIAGCDEHPRSMKTLSVAPIAAWSSRTLAGSTTLSYTPETITVGTLRLTSADCTQTREARRAIDERRTPAPHVAPTGSDASISVQTASLTAGSFCAGHHPA